MDELIKLDQVDEISINLEPANDIDLDLGEVLGVVRPPELESVEVMSTREEQVVTPSKFGAYIDEVVVKPIPKYVVDVRDTTATAETVLQGQIFYDFEGTRTEGVAELKEDLDTELTAQDDAILRLENAVDNLPADKGCTCGGVGTGDYYVKVIDYDGTVLAEKRLNNGDTYTLPNAPSHDGLVFQEWSCSQEIVDGVITISNNNVMVGATYTTASGLSEFDITLTKVTGLSVTLNMDGTKNWGDGTSDDSTTHTYTEYGDYTITCDGATMTAMLFGQNNSIPNYYCTTARLNNVTAITESDFSYCYSLKSVVVPRGVVKVEGYAFNMCVSLTSIIIPNGCTQVNGNHTFSGCYSLESVVFPHNGIKLGTSTFNNCYSLVSVVIPDDLVNVKHSVFNNCYSLTYMAIPKNINEIQKSFFYQCYSIIKYDFTQHSVIPTLEYTNSFGNINKICKIYVPDELYDEWIMATNWATYADYIYKASEMEA